MSPAREILHFASKSQIEPFFQSVESGWSDRVCDTDQIESRVFPSRFHRLRQFMAISDRRICRQGCVHVRDSTSRGTALIEQNR